MRRIALLSTMLLAGAVRPAFAADRGPLDVEPGLMIWTIIVFLLLLFVLWKAAWPQILGAVEAREQRLEAQIAETERNRVESARLLDEHRKLVADAKTSAQSILTDARGVAERERALAIEKTKVEQGELLDRARREIAAERDRALADLRREAVDLSLSAAGKLIGARMDSEADRALVTSFLESIGERAR